jgi:formylglycine-generating enzyme required for sulfatase activity
MEYIAGKTLQDRLDGNGPLDLKEVLRIGRQVADGLAAAHAMGIIHRDVKPANILLENGVDHVKITDFGLARAADDASLSQSGVIAGTPMYMAPEQAMGETLDHRADLFSLGSVLYVMCTGRPPFRASTTFAVLKRVAEDTPRPMREVIPEIPEWLCAIVARLHAKKPEDRYASAKEVADLLASCLSELQLRGAVSSPPPGPATPQRSEPPREGLVPAPVAPRARRSGRRWMAAAAVLILLLTGLGVTEVTGLTHLAGGALRLFHPNREVPPVPDEPPPLAIAPFDAKQASAHQEAWAKHLHVPVEVQNSIGMKLRLIPPGEFLMGSTQEEVDAVLKEIWPTHADQVRSEAPQRVVKISEPFLLGAYEVTVGEFRQFVKANGYRTQAEASGKGGLHWDNDANKAVTDPEDVWNNVRLAPTDEYPVCVLTRPDAQAFCEWLSSREGVRYVLPNEEQWEYACRAGTTGRWCSGDDPEQAMRFGWFGSNTGGVMHPVGGKTPNAFGLFDMHSNVSEYVRNPEIWPVLRGGNAGYPVWQCRSAWRAPETTEDPWVPSGFRVAVVGDLSKFNPDQPTGTGSRKVPEGPPPPLAVAPFDAKQAGQHQEAWAKHLGGPVEINNSIGIKLALIPPGQFLMGSPDGEASGETNIEPPHEVVITKPFYMGVHDVTVGQFKAFVKVKNYQTEAELGDGARRFFPNGGWKIDPNANWQNPGFEQTDEHPVVCVSWNDARAFCEWLSAKEGKHYALPTEAQWEYGCRAGSQTKFYFGDDDQEAFLNNSPRHS